jgi:hypothetical protein
MNSVHVINSNGQRERFSFQKVYRSARNVGASKESANRIAATIEKEIYPEIKTSKIFARVKELLYKETPGAALKFNIKEGIRKLGPTGFPFEKFVSEIFKKLGFETQTNLFLSGFCLNDYETDFVARKENLIYVGECKYRNFAGEEVHLRDALANYARFQDVLKGPYFEEEKKRNYQVKTIMVTNARFTSRAVQYFSCMDIDYIGWKSPKNNSLEYLIEKYGLYPITILPSLKGYLENIFVSEKMMMAQDVAKIDPQEFSKKFNISIKHLSPLIEEAKLLLATSKK